MRKSSSFHWAALFLPCLVIFLGGCQFFSDSCEKAASLDRAGESREAIQAYQDYLKKHPSTLTASRVYYRIAKNYESLSDYKSALVWYGEILAEYPKTDEANHALLDMASLYQNKLKDPVKAKEYDQRAFDRYMDNDQLRVAVQPLIEAQYQTATALFTQKDYQKAGETAANIFQVYPASLLSPDTHNKVQALVDRARLAENISKAAADMIILKNEIPFDASYEPDFAPQNPDSKMIPSPDGSYWVSRKKDSDGIYYLYLAKAPPKGKKALFKRVLETAGADKPSWSPDGQELLYCQTADKTRKLEKTNIKTKKTVCLFSTRSKNMGIHPVFHPSGNMIAYIYEGRVCLINAGINMSYVYEGSASSAGAGETYFKQLLKTKLKLSYTAELEWSMDGTVIRCRQTDKKGKMTDELLVLDVVALNNP
jgi:hypothetical protein